MITLSSVFCEAHCCDKRRVIMKSKERPVNIYFGMGADKYPLVIVILETSEGPVSKPENVASILPPKREVTFNLKPGHVTPPLRRHILREINCFNVDKQYKSSYAIKYSGALSL